MLNEFQPRELLRLDFCREWLDGVYPHLHALTINESLAVLDCLPEGVHAERSVTLDSSVAIVARGPDVSLLLEVTAGSTEVLVSAPTPERASAVAADINRRVSPRSRDEVTMRVWWRTRDGHFVARDRVLDAPRWDEIAANYPVSVRGRLERIFALDRPTASGKLILWHGEPGTGKTTAVRALARQWLRWCSPQYISDPEAFFADTGYVTSVLTRASGGNHSPTLTSAGGTESKWTLIVAEDTDEYLRANARQRSGASLGRLLNLTDGILGQGLNVLILMTTNEDLGRLHPAIVRPGRCLATVEFGRFPAVEAQGWLDRNDGPVGEPTLAELLQRRGDIGGLDPPAVAAPAGAYL